MSISAHSPYEEPESSSTKWVLTFVLLSLLAHAVIIIALLLITIFLPPPKVTLPAPPPATTLTLESLPPAPPKQKPLFVPTKPQANVTPTKQRIESANDTKLTSKNQVARDPNSLLPDVTGKPHSSDLNDSPAVKAPPKPEVSSTPPTPKQATPQKPTPPQPNPNQGKQPTTKPAQPTKPAPPTPPQPKPTPQVDANGFPVLPPINAPTLAPPDSAAPAASPAPSQREQAANSHGAIGLSGDNSPAAMSSVLGKYRQKVYAAVGSVWDVKVDSALQLLGVGEVRVQYTIYADGTVETKVLDPGGANLQNLLSISINSIREAAPYDKFDDYPGLREAIIKEQGGDGSSYTGDFTFSIYSTN